MERHNNLPDFTSDDAEDVVEKAVDHAFDWDYKIDNHEIAREAIFSTLEFLGYDSLGLDIDALARSARERYDDLVSEE